jgi:lysophospholipase L1-like esterase
MGALFGTAAAAAEKNLKLVMLGDSVTLGASAPKEKTIPVLVQEALNKEFKGRIRWTVVNAGVGSETSQGGLGRVAGVLAKEKPDFVSLAYGLNDAREKKAEWFDKQMRLLVEAAEKNPAKAELVLISATPFVNEKHFWGKDPFFVQKGGLDAFLDKELNAVTRRLAAEKDIPFCDMHRAFVAKSGWGKLLLDDGVHPNAEGNEFAAETFARCFAAFIKAKVEKNTQAVKQEKDLRAAVGEVKKAGKGSGEIRKRALEKMKQALEKCPYVAEAYLLLDGSAGSDDRPEPANP